jgi:hypothetical protein
MNKKSILKKYTGKGGPVSDALKKARNTTLDSTTDTLSPLYNAGKTYSESQAKIDADKLKVSKGLEKAPEIKSDGSLSNAEMGRLQADEVRDSLSGKITPRPIYPKNILKRAVIKSIPQNFYNPAKKNRDGETIKPIFKDVSGFKSNFGSFKIDR